VIWLRKWWADENLLDIQICCSATDFINRADFYPLAIPTRKPNAHFNRPFWPFPPLGFTNVGAIFLYEPAWRSVIVWHNILTIALLDDVMFKTLMTQLIFLLAFIAAEKRKFTQTLNVRINSCTTENAYTGTRKYLLLCLDRKYKQWT